MSEYIDNQGQRKEKLKAIIRRLHEGQSVEDVKEEFAALLQDVGASEISDIEQALIEEGLPESEIKRLCDVHVAVFRESLDQQPRQAVVSGHPIDVMQAENEAAEEVLDRLGQAIEHAAWDQARQHLRELRQYDRHYLRKENILFPYLEKHGFSGPSAVMWAIHDDVRDGWKKLVNLLEDEANAEHVSDTFETLDRTIREMFYKEENILFPTAMDRLSEEEWAEIHAQGPEIGYCYVTPGEYAAESAAPERHVTATPVQAPQTSQIPKSVGQIGLETGALSPYEINWMLKHLPVDVTYVDKDDTVRFFSQTKERIFPRSPAIIGRAVQKCHPPASVDRVQRILDDFRTGRRDEAEFWIQMQGKFIHIRYFALRDAGGAYQGTIEVSQDVTHIRQLEGERRLLDE
ncbi:MAG TPA: DUF438 domain-containing protein [Chloroflexi bacterium]|nr:DUF438 domain-containing protein [Chloroflexota bacterium]